ncbi:hypothetical protein [Sandarakinorhabdus sp. DWP1-3-1]|uniref:hypothetical protein n=1 Tax=Sandarakinorhabdus sp. DWP1-3-1 TaxID=2804627 RepID=UPI003CFA764A
MRRTRTATNSDIDPGHPSAGRLVIAVLAAAVIANLVRGFLHLGTESFILDELFTAWVIGPGGDAGAMFGRALADTHPPLYYTLLFGYAELAGRSEAALRSLSAIIGVATMLLFWLGTRRWFSPAARLFAMVLATGSEYWLYQMQTARSYALLFLLATALLVLALALFAAEEDGDTRRARRCFAALVGISLVAGFTHFYGMLTAIAVFGTLFYGLPRWRWPALAVAVGLAGVLLAYVVLVMRPSTEFATTGSWILNTPAWYYAQSRIALARPLWPGAVLALVVLAGLALWRRPRLAGLWPQRFEPRLITVTVPVLLALAAVASSLLVSPSFTARNILVALPFAWGAAALLFDSARIGDRRRLALFATLFAATALWNQWQPRPPMKTPFRQSARWLATESGCAGRTLPVLVDAPIFRTPAIAARQAEADYGHYLGDAIDVRGFALADVLARRPVPASGCRVIAWGAHYVTRANVGAVATALAATQGGTVTTLTFGDRAPAYVFLSAP